MLGNSDKKDIGMVQDLLQALINVASIEHHAISSYWITKEKKWIELKDIARNIRRKWLDLLVKEDKGELWCISKHMLLAIEALIEVGDRLTHPHDKRIIEGLPLGP